MSKDRIAYAKLVVKPGDIVQITSKEPEGVEGTLLIVEDIHNEFIEGYTHIPYKGKAYFTVEHHNYTRTKGRAGNV